MKNLTDMVVKESEITVDVLHQMVEKCIEQFLDDEYDDTYAKVVNRGMHNECVRVVNVDRGTDKRLVFTVDDGSIKVVVRKVGVMDPVDSAKFSLCDVVTTDDFFNAVVNLWSALKGWRDVFC